MSLHLATTAAIARRRAAGQTVRVGGAQFVFTRNAALRPVGRAGALELPTRVSVGGVIYKRVECARVTLCRFRFARAVEQQFVVDTSTRGAEGRCRTLAGASCRQTDLGVIELVDVRVAAPQRDARL
jgi:hypothetical protein